ncbi:SwmB domain-containing protein [Prochlorococcus marinus]|uniref:SwmB domain-containing protein n=1 Tax=Prochlorococcus marinus TaxID=1219 RepID=UPI0022B36F38|nr:SwmB domain-containing protein [Prochlorococcus marinus]
MSAPRFQKAIVNGAGTKVILTYSETLSSTTVETSAFEVTVDGSAVSISSAEVSGSTVELTLASQVDHATPVKVSYADPSDDETMPCKILLAMMLPQLVIVEYEFKRL